MLGDDGVIDRTDLVFVVIEDENFSFFRWDRVHWISAEEVGHKIVLARSIHKGVIVLFE